MGPFSDDHEPAAGRPRKALWFFVIIGSVAAACIGGAVLTAVKVGHNLRADAAAVRPTVVFPSSSASVAPAPEASAGPQASTYPVRKTDDLKRVCDHWYYPKSPKVQAKAFNPVKAFVSDSLDQQSRTESQLYDVPWRATPAIRAAWDPAALAKVRLVACADLTGAGARLKSCKFNDSKPATVPMKQGDYTLSVYEVATGRRLAEKKVKGEDTACPFVVLLGADHTIYSSVSDRQLFEALRTYVEK